MQNTVLGQKRELNLCQEKCLFLLQSGSEHHAIQTVFHKLLVHCHELGGESFKVVDSFVAQLQSVFIVSCHVGHVCLQLAVAVTQQLGYQTLFEDRKRKINTYKLKRF